MVSGTNHSSLDRHFFQNDDKNDKTHRAQNVYLSRPATCCFRTWTDCATNLTGQWSWMVWADDDFSYFDWLNRLAKFRHGVLPDHVSFGGIFFFFKFGVRRFVPETIDIIFKKLVVPPGAPRFHRQSETIHLMLFFYIFCVWIWLILFVWIWLIFFFRATVFPIEVTVLPSLHEYLWYVKVALVQQDG